MKTPSKSATNTSISRIVTALKQCPALTSIGPDDTTTKKKLLKCLDEMATQETPILRKAIEEFIAECRRANNYSVDEMSKLWVLNRYIFDVPAKSKLQDARFFGGFLGVPHDEKDVNLLWPLGTTLNGKLALVGVYRGGYMGDDFQAVDEFDYFDKRFGRRASPPTRK